LGLGLGGVGSVGMYWGGGLSIACWVGVLLDAVVAACLCVRVRVCVSVRVGLGGFGWCGVGGLGLRSVWG
jgi:hypothetical protein